MNMFMPPSAQHRSEGEISKLLDQGEAAVKAGKGSLANSIYNATQDPTALLSREAYERKFSPAVRRRIANAYFTICVPGAISHDKETIEYIEMRLKKEPELAKRSGYSSLSSGLERHKVSLASRERELADWVAAGRPDYCDKTYTYEGKPKR